MLSETEEKDVSTRARDLLGFSRWGQIVAVAAGLEGTQYTLFPSLVANYYGERYSSANYAVLYSTKILGGVFGGVVAGWLAGVAGWTTVFLVGSALAIGAGIGALALRPSTE